MLRPDGRIQRGFHTSQEVGYHSETGLGGGGGMAYGTGRAVRLDCLPPPRVVAPNDGDYGRQCKPNERKSLSSARHMGNSSLLHRAKLVQSVKLNGLSE